jgi:hypothetical protein
MHSAMARCCQLTHEHPAPDALEETAAFTLTVTADEILKSLLIENCNKAGFLHSAPNAQGPIKKLQAVCQYSFDY